MDDGKSSPIEAELAERVGTLINERYRVLRVIGHGSTGAVYACQHVGLDKLVALKVLHREMEQNASFVDRFKLEAQAASRLEHPNSVRVLDFGQDLASGALFIAMEYIEGRDLLQVLEEDGPFSAERAVDVMSQILDVLGVAHAAGIVHRDLKPENILLRSVEIDGVTREHVTVCDFGIAQFGGRRNAAADGGGSPDGEEGLVAGTPAYMSPEQARAEPQDARSDVYSAGVVLYQLLTLQLPFYSDDAYALALKHCVEVPPPPSRFGAVSPQLEEICLKALSKSRDARYQSAREMRQALQRVLKSQVSQVFTDGSSLSTDGSGKVRRWGRPRPVAQGTPSDAPAVEMSPSPSRASGAWSKVWRYSLAGAATLTCMMCAGMFLNHNQEPRASAAGPSSAARDVSVMRPSRPQTPQTPPPSSREAAASQRSAAGSTSTVVQPARIETAYSAAPTTSADATGAELPEARVSLPAGPLHNDIDRAAASGSAGADDAKSAALAEIESLVGDPGEGSRRGNASQGTGSSSSKTARAHAEPSRTERRGQELAQVVRVTLPAAVSGQDSKEKPAVAPQRAELATDKPADTHVAHHEAPSPGPDARPQARPHSLELGLLPDDSIESAVAPAAEATSASAASANRTPKPVLVSRIASEPKEEAAREPANRAASASTGSASTSAHVSITNIASRSGVSKSSVRSALNLSAISDCYRSAVLGGDVTSSRVVGELELSTSQSGSVTEANLNAPELPTPVRHCVEQIVRRGRVREADTGNAQATITLAFLPR